MDKETINMVMGIFFICMGLLAAIFHRFMATKAIQSQRPLRSLLPGRKEAGPTEIRVTNVAFLIVGLLFVLIGVLTLFMVISFK